MKISITSDLHGVLPEIPDCDLLIMAGDYSPDPKNEYLWLLQVFKPWLQSIRNRGIDIIACAGNHDILFERQPHIIESLDLNWTYLENKSIEWNSINIYGMPQNLRFFDWGFNCSEEEMYHYCAEIPANTDILITHQPPKGILDYSNYGNVNTGSFHLLNRVKEIKPKYHIFGHIHESYGQVTIDNTTYINASHMNEKYKPINPVITVEI